MREHYHLLLEKMELPQEAMEDLTAAASAIIPAYEKDLREIIDKFYDQKFNIRALAEDLTILCEKSLVNRFTVNFVFLACASERMLADYRKANLPEQLFWDTIMDLKYKLFECKTVKGVWGNFVEFWYPIFYSLDIFKLGRLEFERIRYDGERPYEWEDISLKKGDILYSVHIPSCGSLSKELRMDSYRRAYDFFQKERGNRPLICLCYSWLLFPGNRQIFPPHINLVDFMDDWDIVHSEESDTFYNAWRVFGKEYKGDVKDLPQQTSQQKALAAWLKEGKKTGEGLGILVFDGEKIVNVKESTKT